jgi:O-antigen ligase
MAVTLCVNFLLIQPGRIRILWTACLGLLLSAIILTETRSVWFGLMVSLPLALFLQENMDLKRKVKVFFIGSGLLLFIGWITWYMGYWDEMIHRGVSYRPQIWLTTIQNTLGTNLLFGNGIVTNSELMIDGYDFQHPHSIYISTFFYGGLAGLVLLLLLIATSFWEVLKVRLSPLAILAASSLSYAVTVFLFDGDRLLTKVDFVWIAFWLPISLCLISTLKNSAIEIDWEQSADSLEFL